MSLIRKGWDGYYELRTIENKPVPGPGSIIIDFHKEVYFLSDGIAPHDSGKAGFIYTEEGSRHYPQVFNLKWVLIPAEIPMTKLATKKQAVRHLRGLANGSIKPQYSKLGLCTELDEVLGINTPAEYLFPNWPLFSGRMAFPVCGGDDPMVDHTDPGELYKNTTDLWADTTNIYVQNRRLLCTWLADCYEHMPNTQYKFYAIRANYEDANYQELKPIFHPTHNRVTCL